LCNSGGKGRNIGVFSLNATGRSRPADYSFLDPYQIPALWILEKIYTNRYGHNFNVHPLYESYIQREVDMIRYNNLAEAEVASHMPHMALAGPEVALVRAAQSARGMDTCFKTAKRLTCRDYNCEWRGECCRLMAAWLR
jgi:hypothetical protein